MNISPSFRISLLKADVTIVNTKIVTIAEELPEPRRKTTVSHVKTTPNSLKIPERV